MPAQEMPQDYHVALGLINLRPLGLYASQIGKALGLNRQQASSICNALYAKALIERVRDAEGYRAWKYFPGVPAKPAPVQRKVE